MKNINCKDCKFAEKFGTGAAFSFIGCKHKPYKGKWIAEIENCPKEAKEKYDRDKNIF